MDAAKARRKKRKDLQTTSTSRAREASSDGKGRKMSKKGNAVSEIVAGTDAGAGDGAKADSGDTAPAPAPMVVTFSAAGSLGMGLEADVTEEGTMCLAGKAPTSAAAGVPNGWRVTDVNGKSVRRLGGGLERERERESTRGAYSSTHGCKLTLCSVNIVNMMGKPYARTSELLK